VSPTHVRVVQQISRQDPVLRGGLLTSRLYSVVFCGFSFDMLDVHADMCAATLRTCAALLDLNLHLSVAFKHDIYRRRVYPRRERDYIPHCFAGEDENEGDHGIEATPFS